MVNDTSQLDSFLETLGREALSEIQLKKLQLVLEPVLESNPFYKRKLGDANVRTPRDLRRLSDMQELPFTTKAELSADQVACPPYGSNLTHARERYTRIHQTAGTTGDPLRWLDTEESWNWWARCWETIYRAAGVTRRDRIFFAFSFGPFIGFWSAYDGGNRMGALCIPGGGMSSYQRAKAILTHDVSVLVCTPTYALHLAEVADQQGIDLVDSNVNVTIQAGEPGASVAETRRRIESAWGSRCYDHVGTTEVGAWGFECQTQSGVHVNEGEFIWEVVDPETGQATEEGELVLTNLGRIGMPVIRYRTGDHVKIKPGACECGRGYVRFEGGVIGRIDDVMVVRGVSVFPSAIESIVRRFDEIGEFAVDVRRIKELDRMEIRIEVKGAKDDLAGAVAHEIQNGLGLRARITPVAYGTLPRFDLHARRFTDHRQPHSATVQEA